MFCPTCGKQLDDDAKFCSKCGARQDVEKESASNTTPPLKLKRNRRKRIVAVFAVVLALIAGGVLTNGFGLLGKNGKDISGAELEDVFRQPRQSQK